MKRMNNLIKTILLISLITSCKPKPEESNQAVSHQKLTIKYTGDADVVQFKMFEGVHQILTKDTISKVFMGTIEIPNLNDAIFSYELIVHKKDTTGRMLEVGAIYDLIKLNEQVAIEKGNRFIWIGKNRKGDYFKSQELMGSITTLTIKSDFLEEGRALTVYTPKEIDANTPHIYFTDGSVVEVYAPYVDNLISIGAIMPVKLIGIHSSRTNRYEEYVQGSNDNELFKKHEKFVYNEVLTTIEKDIESWKGKRFLYGFSNGAAFCVHAGLNHPKVFEEIIAYSTADYISAMAQFRNPTEFKHDRYPEFQMGAGMYETSIFKDNEAFVKKMEENKLRVEFKAFISGHDYNVWRIEFLEYLETRFSI